MTESIVRGNMMIGNSNRNVQPCIGCIHLFSDKTAMTLKRAALLAYPVHVISLNMSAKTRK